MTADLAGSRHQSGTSTPISNGNGNPGEPAMLRGLLTAGRKPHVCIVGAGVAGLRCADILLQHGVKVTMLEARNRVGGRLCQAKVGSHLVDLGPNWIHGTLNNPILDLVQATGTVTNSFGERQAAWDSDGKPLGPETRAAYSEMLWGLIDEAIKYSHDHTADIPKDESLYDFIRNRIESKFADVGEEEHFKSSEIEDKELFYHMAEIWGAFVGGTIAMQSMKFMWLEQCLDGENPFVAGTYKKVLDVIAEPAVGAGIIKFGQAVKKVVSKRHAESGSPQVEVSTEEGYKATFDEVVFTAPLGWLKKNHHQTFEPALPERISQAVHNLGYGNLDKASRLSPLKKNFVDVNRSISRSPKPSGSQAQPTTLRTPATRSSESSRHNKASPM
jgi:Flavin containing amine oxidoreductase